MNVSNLFQKEGAGKISSFTRVFVWMLFILFGYSLVALGQPAPVPYHYQPYLLESGIHNGRGDWETEAFPAYKEIVQVKEAPWLRLKFADANLGRHSYLMLTSLKDGPWQRLNALSLAGFPEPDWQMPDPPHPAVSGYRLYQPAASTAVAAFHGSGALPLEGAVRSFPKLPQPFQSQHQH